MDTQVQRVVAWREQKRRDGYQPLTVWLQADIKHRIEDLAAERRQDLGQVLTEMVLAYGYARYVGPTEVETVHRIVDERLALLVSQMGTLAPVPSQAPHATPLTPDALLLPGEHGAQIQALRRVAKDLKRFTLPKIAREIGVNPRNIYTNARKLVQNGEWHKSKSVYFWRADPGAPAAGDEQP
jgi:hypothetical protein